MVELYWAIVEEEQHGKTRAEYGKSLLKDLSVKLTSEFGSGFEERELRRMRQFYVYFPIRDAVRPELSWTHYKILLRVVSEDARHWYMNEAADQNWSSRGLERQINVLYFERLLSSKFDEGIKNEGLINLKKDIFSPLGFIRDPYVPDFLQLNPNSKIYENDLETGLLDHIQSFLMELGKGFAFVARQ